MKKKEKEKESIKIKRQVYTQFSLIKIIVTTQILPFKREEKNNIIDSIIFYY